MKNAATRRTATQHKLADKLAEMNRTNRALAARLVAHMVDEQSPDWGTLGNAEYIQEKLLEVLIGMENKANESEIDTACRILADARKA